MPHPSDASRQSFSYVLQAFVMRVIRFTPRHDCGIATGRHQVPPTKDRRETDPSPRTRATGATDVGKCLPQKGASADWCRGSVGARSRRLDPPRR